jgi:hypothetical protein
VSVWEGEKEGMRNGIKEIQDKRKGERKRVIGKEDEGRVRCNVHTVQYGTVRYLATSAHPHSATMGSSLSDLNALNAP